jgi:4'-phosphopantetheinyl transferase
MSVDEHVRTLATPPSEFAWAWALERPAGERLAVRVLPALTVAGRLPPRAEELVLWFGVPGVRGWPGLQGYLSEDEAAQADRFRFEADRWSFAAAHAGLRLLLAPMMGCAPQALRFTMGANGKPCLDRDRHGVALHFNISHTRGCVAVALAGRRVGVDVEQRRSLPDLLEVARTAFAPQGYDALAACADPAERAALFFRFWTLGEAFIKATGEGVAQGLSSFAFTAQGTPRLAHVSADWGPVTRWRFCCGP